MNYLEELQAECEADQAERQRQKQTSAVESVAAYRDQMSPLIDRLRTLLDSIPREILQHGVSLPDLQARLRGRTAQKAHVAELGAALRSLGYARVRLWRQRAAAPFSAVWKATK